MLNTTEYSASLDRERKLADLASKHLGALVSEYRAENGGSLDGFDHMTACVNSYLMAEDDLAVRGL